MPHVTLFVYIFSLYIFTLRIFTVFNLLCISAFEQGHLEPWRNREAFIIILSLYKNWTYRAGTERRIEVPTGQAPREGLRYLGQYREKD